VILSQASFDGENDALEICSVDFSSKALQNYKYFDDNTYDPCKELLPPDQDLINAQRLIKEEKLPLYRYMYVESGVNFYNCNYCVTIVLAAKNNIATLSCKLQL